MWLSMRRVVIAVVISGACLSLAGCAHSNQVAYAKPLPWPPTKASGMKPPQQHVRRSSKPTKVSSVKLPSPPVGKVPNPIKVSSLKPPPLPPRKPQSPMHPRSLVKPMRAGERWRPSSRRPKQKQSLAESTPSLRRTSMGLSLEQIKELRGY